MLNVVTKKSPSFSQCSEVKTPSHPFHLHPTLPPHSTQPGTYSSFTAQLHSYLLFEDFPITIPLSGARSLAPAFAFTKIHSSDSLPLCSLWKWELLEGKDLAIYVYLVPNLG